jgi:hypothetical protein
VENFEELMFEALDDTLRRVLGKNISELIHSFKERQTQLKLTDISNNIDDIIAYLEKLIGKEGTQIIQTISIKRLFLKLKHEYEKVEAHFLLLDELYEMKFKLLAPLETEKHSDHN